MSNSGEQLFWGFKSSICTSMNLDPGTQFSPCPKAVIDPARCISKTMADVMWISLSYSSPSPTFSTPSPRLSPCGCPNLKLARPISTNLDLISFRQQYRPSFFILLKSLSPFGHRQMFLGIFVVRTWQSFNWLVEKLFQSYWFAIGL